MIWDIPSNSIFKHRKNKSYKDFGNEAEAYIIDEEPRQSRKSSKGINIPIIILGILLLLITAVLCYSIFVVPSNNGATTGEYLREIVDTLFG